MNLPQRAVSDATDLENMAVLEGGVFVMGSDRHYPEERPAHKVRVAGFRIDRHLVTNREFGQFVTETGHVTLPEREIDPADYPDADPQLLLPASVVFVAPPGPVDLRDTHNWWHYILGADWRHPRGPDSDIVGLEDHPVVQVGYDDALAYAQWAGKDLPTEAEWEFAAWAGHSGSEFAWGDELVPGGHYMANTWQGEFPWKNEASDGYRWTSPVGAFPPNDFGLYDMIGNVWEWTQDWYQGHGGIKHACCTLDNPRGPRAEDSVDENAAGPRLPRRVMKGGSHVCAPNYCRRYRPAARMAQPIDTATSHLGFRCVVRE